MLLFWFIVVKKMPNKKAKQRKYDKKKRKEAIKLYKREQKRLKRERSE